MQITRAIVQLPYTISPHCYILIQENIIEIIWLSLPLALVTYSSQVQKAIWLHEWILGNFIFGG